MEFMDVVKSRRSIRHFADQPVEEEKLQKILEVINSAPSAGNLQAYEVYIVRRVEQRAALARAAYDQDFITQAPVALVFCTHSARSEVRYRKRGKRLYTLQDATIACTFAMLAITDLGLGSVWVGAFDDDAVRQVMQLPPGLAPVAILPIGYPAEHPSPRSRRRLNELIHEM
jgi:nitroreductase